MSLRGGEDVPLNKHLDRLHLKAESPLPRSPSKTFPAPEDLATDGHWAIAAHGGAGAISDTASIPARLKEFSDAFAFGQQMLRNGATAMDAVQEALAPLARRRADARQHE